MSNLESNSIILGYLNSGGSAGSCYINGIADTYASLPDHHFNLGKIYIVLETTGAGIFRHQKGLYYCKPDSWVRLGDIPSYFSDAIMEIYNNDDISKKVKFDLHRLTSGMTRAIKVPDHDIDFDDTGITNSDYWSAEKIIDYINKSDNIPIVDTVVEANDLGLPTRMVYVIENETYYQYILDGGSYFVDDTYTLSTIDLGSTRWIAVSGKYVLKGVNFKEGILTSIIDCGDF